MPRQRQLPPSPISIPLPPNLTTASTSAIPLTTYLALPAPAATPNFFLRLKRSASQLRSNSPTPSFVPALTPPVSPTPSGLLSPTLFPLPPNREEEEQRERPFANLAPRSPTTGLKPWLELPTSGTLSFFPTTQGHEEKEDESRWPLTPESPYTPLKEPYSPQRHSPSRQGKSLVFPHKPRGVATTTSIPVTRREEAELEDDDSDIDTALSIAPVSPRRFSSVNLPLLPSPPRSPIRNGLLSPPDLPSHGTPQTPPQSRPRSLLAPSPPPTSALPPVPSDNALGLTVDPPATPPRSLRTTPRVTPYAPARPKRIFSTYPSLSTVSPSKRVHFPNGPTAKRRPRTPFPPPAPARPASLSSYSSSESSHESDREDFDFSPSRKASLDTSDSSLSIRSPSRYDKSSPSTTLRVAVHPPPPRPPRSPLRPASRSITPLPSLQPSAFTSSAEGDDDDESEAILRPSRFLSASTSAYRNSTYSLGTVDSKSYYELMGFPQKRYGIVSNIPGIEENPKLSKRGANDVVQLGGLPYKVRESFMRMKFDEEAEDTRFDEEDADSVDFREKFVASGSQDSLDDSFVLAMTEKMLWG